MGEDGAHLEVKAKVGAVLEMDIGPRNITNIDHRQALRQEDERNEYKTSDCFEVPQAPKTAARKGMSAIELGVVISVEPIT